MSAQFDPVQEEMHIRAHRREIAKRIDAGGEIKLIFPAPKLSDCQSTDAPPIGASETAYFKSLVAHVYGKRKR